jgi:hypothetical protein
MGSSRGSGSFQPFQAVHYIRKLDLVVRVFIDDVNPERSGPADQIFLALLHYGSPDLKAILLQFAGQAYFPVDIFLNPAVDSPAEEVRFPGARSQEADVFNGCQADPL